MKRILSIILCCVMTLGIAVAADKKESKPAPVINFITTSHDFGTIAEKGGPAKCEFEFTNRGDAPLVIISATASCGCTRPIFPTEPIKPGKKGVIKVTFLPEGHPGEINKTVKIRTNAPDGKRVSLKLKGYVVPNKQSNKR